MKKIPFIVLVFMLVVGCATVDFTELKAPIEIQVETIGSQSELLELSRLWIADTVQSAEAVLSFESEQSGRLNGNIVDSIQDLMYDVYYQFDIQIDVRDNGARIVLDRIRGVPSAEYSIREGFGWESYWVQARDRMQEIADDYIFFITEDRGRYDW